MTSWSPTARTCALSLWKSARKRLARLLYRSNKALRDGIQLSEAITGDGATIFRHACWMDLEGIVSKRLGSRYVSGRTRS
jgi:ATP-dependent DNA ligase